MIIFMIVVVVITGFFVCAEAYCEREWPTTTLPFFGCAVILLWLGLQVFGTQFR
jgi:uncharacterized membrane protein